MGRIRTSSVAEFGHRFHEIHGTQHRDVQSLRVGQRMAVNVGRSETTTADATDRSGSRHPGTVPTEFDTIGLEATRLIASDGQPSPQFIDAVKTVVSNAESQWPELPPPPSLPIAPSTLSKSELDRVGREVEARIMRQLERKGNKAWRRS